MIVKEDYYEKQDQFNVLKSEGDKNLIEQTILDLISFYSEFGDIQTSCLISLIFKNMIKIKISRLVSVVRGYIKILKQLRLHILLAEVMKYCEIPAI
jgi:hypothetical protein